ncbi:hypothetical protein FNU79_15110 [Deinococcus detaillensis]|uniref:Uncharacterized protein n=1 Tax=Deinococcus detaillensis TaxID=2592048 RepID=A0A553UMK2_9DEIO|nr:hypothetical protein [Deinococcus detaillensis]TSA81456.1 hypothetical protein FNU79_15110 [Deinococcus detaillensis]
MLNTVQVLLCLSVAASGQPQPTRATVKSPAALSRFFNLYTWSTTSAMRAMPTHALKQLRSYRKACKDRPPRIELIVDQTSLGKEGKFEGLGD